MNLWDRHYEDAIPVFDKVLRLSADHPLATRYRQRSQALIGQSVPLDDGGGFPWLIVLAVAAGVAVIGGIAAILLTRRRGGPAPQPLGAAPAGVPAVPAQAAPAPAPSSPAAAPPPSQPPAAPAPPPPALVFKEGPLAGKRVDVPTQSRVCYETWNPSAAKLSTAVRTRRSRAVTRLPARL
jgi:hypothetical protein